MSMAYLFLITELAESWRPSNGFIYTLLVIGAFLFAGVALSIFTFYEDCYWGDESFRKYLKDGNKTSAKI